MKNLKVFGVQELDAKEMRETDGGILPVILKVAEWVAVALAWEIASNPGASQEAMSEGFENGYNSVNF